jgi:hypothetical protein
VGPHGVLRPAGRFAVPDELHQLVRRDRAPGTGQQHGQQDAQPRSANRDAGITGADQQRPEEPEVHAALVTVLHGGLPAKNRVTFV